MKETIPALTDEQRDQLLRAARRLYIRACEGDGSVNMTDAYADACGDELAKPAATLAVMSVGVRERLIEAGLSDWDARHNAERLLGLFSVGSAEDALKSAFASALALYRTRRKNPRVWLNPPKRKDSAGERLALQAEAIAAVLEDEGLMNHGQATCFAEMMLAAGGSL